MAHKTMVGGTAYEISGGKALVDGTAYSIKGGKTLVDGTAYEIGFEKEFTINSTTFQFIDGMTWGKWIESDYCTDKYVPGTGNYQGFKITGNEIDYVYDYVDGALMVRPIQLSSTQRRVFATDLIIENYVYYAHYNTGL